MSNQNRACEVMVEKAHDLGVNGVAVALVSDNFDILEPCMRVVNRAFRDPDPEGRGPDDQGTNYYAVAWAKVAQMLRTQKDSGTRFDELGQPVIRYGEVPYRGGRIVSDGKRFFLTAFSGSTAENDLIIASAGIKALLEG